ncbi:KPN_02809 family neutral zinc metallopeptidase [Leifsonia sp. Leaf264]|uniref:KPN_02809 family neutral zinc metallopeptidase n=1 Tax=Leifsonia sp. Leaf264 TaxID=1736314 RepID=UPI0006FD34C2|nr:neutral zinc metallopeptidase [Leifsonia sp. Leaf264]KQO97545.1 neutral zinc metallopeptidase [Leifsonia sp. Leaf264]
MTFDDNAKLGGGKVSKRGRNVGIGVGGGIGVIAIVLIGQLLGVDLSGIVGAGGGGGSDSASDEVITGCETGADANANIDCRIEAAAESLDAYWAEETPALGAAYATTNVSLFTDATQTGCGNATSAVGPFYCPPDQRIYLDTAFYDELRSRFGASGGPLAEMYVIAHEWGHHIQNLTGAIDASQSGATGAASASVRVELQADCYAGAWAAAASEQPTAASDVPLLEPVTKAQIADALNAAASIGDDRIQESSGGAVNPEAWTHGSSEQRQRWFQAGYDGGAEACDTFSVADTQL